MGVQLIQKLLFMVWLNGARSSRWTNAVVKGALLRFLKIRPNRNVRYLVLLSNLRNRCSTLHSSDNAFSQIVPITSCPHNPHSFIMSNALGLMALWALFLERSSDSRESNHAPVIALAGLCQGEFPETLIGCLPETHQNFACPAFLNQFPSCFRKLAGKMVMQRSKRQ